MSDLSSLIGGVTSGVGSLVGGLVGAHSTDQATSAAEANVAATNAANQKIAEENRGFQEHMSNTAYQRAVGDMCAAGLNPAVMLQGAGSSASTPTGSMIPVQSAADSIMSGAREKSRIYSGMAGDAVKTAGDALSALMVPAQKKQVEAQTANAAKTGVLLDKQAEGKDIENASGNLDLTIKRASNKYYLEHPWLYPVKEALGDVSRIAGGGVAGGVAGYLLRGRGQTNARSDADWRNRNADGTATTFPMPGERQGGQ